MKNRGKQSERIFGFAKKVFDKNDYPQNYKFKTEDKKLLNGMTFIGMISLVDPPKNGIG